MAKKKKSINIILQNIGKAFAEHSIQFWKTTLNKNSNPANAKLVFQDY